MDDDPIVGLAAQVVPEGTFWVPEGLIVSQRRTRPGSRIDQEIAWNALADRIPETAAGPAARASLAAGPGGAASVARAVAGRAVTAVTALLSGAALAAVAALAAGT